MSPVAVVMNMFYTGLGIARSLGEQGIRVVGLSAHRGIYGNFTRYAKVLSVPDSREDPDALLAFFLQERHDDLPVGSIIFPTRDDDVIFLDRFREQLERRFILVLPGKTALEASLNKWETHRYAEAAGVASPRCWMVNGKDELLRISPELRFPCVLKPVSAHAWRKRRNWQIVGGRKAIAVSSIEELSTEYDTVAHADERVLLQEMVAGGDDSLWVAACYMNRDSQLVAGFTAQKLLQVPERFGTGCVIQTVARPDLLALAGKLLKRISFTGIAEVEFKQDSSTGALMLIEINPRPWDQHRLGKMCGVDLIHIAYRDLAGMPVPALMPQKTGQKWIAEDVFSLLLLRSLWHRNGSSLKALLRLVRGQRTYAIWSLADPLPSIGFIAARFGPNLIAIAVRSLWSFVDRFISEKLLRRKEVVL